MATGEGDVIQVYPGLYDLSGMPMTMGSTSAAGVGLKLSMKNGMLVGMGERPGDTVIVCGGSSDNVRVLGVAGSGDGIVVSNLTFTGGYVPGNYYQRGAACLSDNAWMTFTDCQFTNNNCAAGTGVLAGAKVVVRRCRIADSNTESFGGVYGVVRDCMLELGVRGATGSRAQLFSNCTFTGSSKYVFYGAGDVAVDCVFTNNIGNPLFSKAYLTNSLIAFNGSTTQGGRMAITGCEFYGCTIVSNQSPAELMLPNSSQGKYVQTPCVIRNCVIRDNRCGQTGWGFIVATFYNTLIQGNYGPYNNNVRFINDSGLYNCTVVSNFYRSTSDSVVYGASNVVNTVFVGNGVYNYDTSTGESTIAKQQDFNSASVPTAMTNCVWTAQTGEISDMSAFPGCRQVAADELRFADPANGDWTPRKSSPLRNAGWSDEAYLELLGDKDLAGKRRVARDGGYLIDIGAYELNPPLGAIMMIK